MDTALTWRGSFSVDSLRIAGPSCGCPSPRSLHLHTHACHPPHYTPHSTGAHHPTPPTHSDPNAKLTKNNSASGDYLLAFYFFWGGQPGKGKKGVKRDYFVQTVLFLPVSWSCFPLPILPCPERGHSSRAGGVDQKSAAPGPRPCGSWRPGGAAPGQIQFSRQRNQLKT